MSVKGKVVSMRGEVIDMAAIAASQSEIVALGNAGMNARGDVIDRLGNVIKTREVVVQEYYRSNPKAVTKSVSLRDLGDEVLTPQQVIEKLEAKAAVPPKKRKIIDDDSSS